MSLPPQDALLGKLLDPPFADSQDLGEVAS